MAEQIRETAEVLPCDESSMDAIVDNASNNAVDSWLGMTPRTATTQGAASNGVDLTGETLIGKTIGAYQIRSILGQSATSTVYLADRVDQLYSAPAAIKLLNHNVAATALRQFVVEKYTLGQLSHPGIARLYDAGELADGRPYLVMEYVEGESLDCYCDNRQLNIRERVELFIKVCHAVHYAHQHLVVHRDLKPGNILVTREGNPKLLDFGIAKWLDTSRLPDTGQAMTRLVDRVLTPEYASPEQITGQSTTTASDIYTLGVVLYELLSGNRPYQLPAHDFLTTEKLICLLDPTSPGQRLNTQSDADQHRLAELRNETPTSLRKALRGDLNAIVMRALRKEPTQRYESVEQLTDDLTRYLNQAPVLARQGNGLYYSRRFVNRHWVGLSAAAVFLVCTIAMATVLILNTQKLIAERNNAALQLRKADTASNFWLGMFDRDVSPSSHQPVTALNLLDRAAAQIKQDTQLTPDIRVRLLVGIGKSYQGQGKPPQAIPYLEEAVDYLNKHQSENVLLLATALESLGSAQADQWNLEKATIYLQEGIQLMRTFHETQTEQYYNLVNSLGLVEIIGGKPMVGEKNLQKALALAENIFGKDHIKTANTLFAIGHSRIWRGDYVTANSYLEKASRIYKATLPKPGNPYEINTNMALAYTMALLGSKKEAEKISREQLFIQTTIFGRNHIGTASTLEMVSTIDKIVGSLDLAKFHINEAVSISTGLLGEKNPLTAELMVAMSDILVKRKEFYAAEMSLIHSIDVISHNKTNGTHKLHAEYLLAEVYAETHREELALQTLRTSISSIERTPEFQWRIAQAENLMASIQWKLHHDPASRKLLHDSWLFLKNPEHGALPDAISDAKTRTRAILGITSLR